LNVQKMMNLARRYLRRRCKNMEMMNMLVIEIASRPLSGFW
jgi:hypothetical protein